MQATIDEAAAELHRLGYSYGDFDTVGADGRVASVHAYKGERSILVHKPPMAEAYREAARPTPTIPASTFAIDLIR